MGNTASEIFARMRSNLKNPASVITGSFSADHLQAVANELARLYSTEYDQLMKRAHIKTATGDDLVTAARENHGMEKLEATYEEVNLTITGTPGTSIDSTMGAKTDTLVFMIVGTYLIGESGSIEVSARCTEKGAGHTALAGTINQFLKDYAGLDTVTNEKMSDGGYDAESDEDFRIRILENEADIVGYGNIAWYRATAREVAGVEKAKVIELARGRGTVDVLIIANGNTEASETLVRRTKEYIEERKIPGADVLVQSGFALEISVAAGIYLTDGSSIAAVTDMFLKKLQAYLNEISFQASKTDRVSYAKVLDILINCDGVSDIRKLQINNQEESIVLEARSFPVAVQPVLTVEEA